MGFKDLSVAKRLAIGFGLMLAIMAVVTGVAVVKVGAIDAALTVVGQEHAKIQRFAINFRGSAHDRSIAIRDVVLAADAAARDQELARINKLASFYAESAKPLEALVATASGRAEIERLYSAIQAIEKTTVATTDKVAGLVKEGNGAAATSLLWAQAKPQYERWLAAINALIDHQEALIQAESKTASDHASSFLTVMLAALAAALACGVGVSWVISRSIRLQLGAEPIALSLATAGIAGGDLAPIAGEQQAPAASVLAAMAAMRSQLSDIVARVRDGSQTIAGTGAHILQGNQDLSSRTSEQASSLQQTAAAMGRLGTTVAQNADNARQANQLAQGASEVAVKGGAVVAQVVDTMKGINDSSRKIADIISVIDGIAFQTNILALNAAVEAARAGEQGRGFAVVASEVRSLAQRSAQAAKEIKGLITDSVERVEAGSNLVDLAGATMDEVVGAIRRVTDIVAEISSASNEQSLGVGQVGEAISQMEHVTQQNAALVDDSATAAERLKQQAQALVQAVAVFTLPQGNT